MTLEPKTVFKKAAARAAAAPGIVAAGAGAAVASAAMLNPLPLVVWGLGSAAWVLLAATSPRYTRRVLDDERRAAEREADQGRQAMVVKIEAVLTSWPYDAWRRAGLLPDYLRVYHRLLGVRDHVAEVLAECHDAFLASLGIQKQLTYLLAVYLQFVQARLAVVKVLADFRPCANVGEAPLGAASAAAQHEAATEPPVPAGEASGPGPGRHHHRHRRDRRRRGHGASFAPVAASTPPTETGPDEFPADNCPIKLPDVAALLANLDHRIVMLRDLVAREPATAPTREWHIGLLEKQQKLLRDCAGRDQQLVAQLGAIPDVFDVIAGRVSATQFDLTELAAYTSAVVEQIEDSEKLLREPLPPPQPGAAPH
jgi:hypothetical protein